MSRHNDRKIPNPDGSIDFPMSQLNDHMNGLKARYHRFLEWQKRTPISYELNSAETHHCSNCGHDFTGNYCPCCSQRAGTGRLDWDSVRRGLMDVWAMGARSMPFSIWQLFTRPGYFIADYIGGKRMVSFPPVKMLFVMAIIVGFVEYVLFPDKPADGPLDLKGAEGLGEIVEICLDWADKNKGWGMLLRGIVLVLPTWVLFRFAPRFAFHTLPEGFFIQVFLGIQVLVLSFFDHFGVFSHYLALLYFIYTYKQLFGYNLWGTLWRLGTMLLVIFMTAIFIVAAYLAIAVPGSLTYEEGEIIPSILGAIFVFILLALSIALVLYIGYRIGKNSWRKRTAKTSVTSPQS